MKVALVHDYLNQFGGAERVVEVLHELFPDAPIYTSFYIPEDMPATFRKMDIRTSFMQKLPFIHRHFKKYLPLYPLAFEQFDFEGYDLVISSSSAFAKGVITPAGTCHICYCHNPARFLWQYHRYVEQENFGPLVRSFLPAFINKLRTWDAAAVARVDYFGANSRTVKARIKKIYRREAEVINPPVDTARYQPSNRDGDYYLVVSRLNPYKKIDLVIETLNRLHLPLKIVGRGPYEGHLKSIARDNVKFLGKVDDGELARLYAECRALIFPGEEDFGLVPLEAQAAGRPVIAYRGGGALETVIERKTGIFFDRHTVESLEEAVERFSGMSFNKEEIRKHALNFDKEIFKDKLKNFVQEKISEYRRKLLD